MNLGRLSISRKLAALTGGGLVMLAAVAGLGLSSTGSVSASADRLAAVPAVIADVMAADMHHDGSGIYVRETASLPDGAEQDAAAASAREALGLIVSSLQSVRDADLSPDIAAAIDDVMPTVDAYIAAAEAELTAALDGTEGDPGAFSAAFDALGEEMPSVTEAVEAYTADQKESASAVASRGKLLLVLLGLVSLGVCTALSVAISRSIVRPVRRTVEVLDAVATGDLSNRLPVDGTDELGQMATALNTALDRLAGAMTAISDHAGSLASSSEELTSVSSQLASTAQDTSAQASLVSAAAEQVSHNVSTVAAGTGEMTASIQEISHNAQDAVGVASSAAQMAGQTNATMNKLGESSSEIGNVVKVITTIAEQTNLLALNATIEAARAGEAGKGFAVVAHEVKELARATATATSDISERITAIQADVDAAVQAIAEITGIIGRVGDTQSSIASAVEQQTATTNEIGRNVAEAAHGSTEIAVNIDGMARAAQDVSLGASHTLETATDLSRMASELSELVGAFRT